MPPSKPQRLGDVSAMVRLLQKVDGVPASAPVRTEGDSGTPPPATSESVLRKRQMLAEFCRLIGAQLGADVPRGLSADPSLSPRLQQTLERMLGGDSEKQVAARLGLSPHTVHVYVKALYRHFDVSSRGELLAHFVRRSHRR